MATYLIVGASSGIGDQLSKQLISEGHKVIGLSRRPAAHCTAHFLVDITADELPLITDVIDGIAYCPGSITLKPFRALKPADIQRDLDLNVLAAVKVLQQYLPNLQQAAYPAVVLFSTVAVGTGMPYHVSVSIAKAAVEGLTRSLAAEWAPKIRVNCIAPSLTDTPLAGKLLDGEAKQQAAAERHPLKRVGKASEIASLAHFLLSEQAGFVTGQVWHADGGMSRLRI